MISTICTMLLLLATQAFLNANPELIALQSALQSIADVTPIVNGVVGLFVPSVALTKLCVVAVDGTVNDAKNVPLASDITDAGFVVSVVALNFSAIACNGTKLEPVTLTV